MFKRKDKNTVVNPFEKERERIFAEMENYAPDDSEYKELMTLVEKTYKLESFGNKKFWDEVSPDAVVAAAASLGGIMMILTFEKTHIVTSKAMSMVFKPKA